MAPHSDRMTSTGRGGAGNFRQGSAEPTPQDSFETPTIKENTYTTGRGGAGNMVPNVDSESARDAQDVKPVERSHAEEMTHFGRGGAANTTRVPQEGHAEASQQQHGLKGMVEKGKELLTGKHEHDHDGHGGQH